MSDLEELALADYVIILLRWKKVFFSVLGTLLVLSLLFVISWSNYRSTATIQIEQPEISTAATTPLGSNPRDQMEAMADQRISALQQKVLSTASLIEIISKFDLYAHARENTPVALVAEKMRKKIKLDLVSGALANPSAANKADLSAIAFTLSFDYNSPLHAQQVTDELVSRFLDEDLKGRRSETQKTSAFLASQITALEASLSEQEKKIADYQNEHGVVRPETLSVNQQLAASLMSSMQSLDAQIATNEGSIGSLRAQLAMVDPYSRVIADGQVLTTPSVQLKALQGQYAALSAQYGPEHPDVAKIKRQIAALQPQVGRVSKEASQLKAQIVDARTNLEAAQKTYGPEHPDVEALKRQLHNLEDRLTSMRPQSSAAISGYAADADNPAYMQIVAQLQSSEEQGKSLREQRKGVQEQLDKYRKALNETPEAQKEMAELSRDYENSQLRYRELKEKKMAADMDEQMQKDRTGQRLTLINPPELPIDTQPVRFLLLVACLVFSMVGGLGGVVVAQVMAQCIVGARHLEQIVGVAPLVAIPHLYTQDEREKSLVLRFLRNSHALADLYATYRGRLAKRR